MVMQISLTNWSAKNNARGAVRAEAWLSRIAVDQYLFSVKFADEALKLPELDYVPSTNNWACSVAVPSSARSISMAFTKCPSLPTMYAR
jgi:hypothetical protein